jgi:hypothetical protein
MHMSMSVATSRTVSSGGIFTLVGTPDISCIKAGLACILHMSSQIEKVGCRA